MLIQNKIENIDHTIELKLVYSIDNGKFTSYFESKIIQKSSGDQKINIKGLKLKKSEEAIEYYNRIYLDYKAQGYTDIQNNDLTKSPLHFIAKLKKLFTKM